MMSLTSIYYHKCHGERYNIAFCIKLLCVKGTIPTFTLLSNNNNAFDTASKLERPNITKCLSTMFSQNWAVSKYVKDKFS